MGRYSFSKIRGELDLSPYLKGYEELVSPWKSEDHFGRKAPLELEIGSGKGLFLKNAASRSPDHLFAGIEVSYRYAMTTAARLCKANLKNAIIIHADAARFLNEMVLENELEAVHVYFPDPWWKKAHRKRRILREDVLRRIEFCLRPGGELHFWTDVEEYYLSTLELIAARTTLEGPFPVTIPEELPEEDASEPGKRDIDHFYTHFERRTRLKFQPVYRSIFRKSCAKSF